jgi:hypothetical protein
VVRLRKTTEGKDRVMVFYRIETWISSAKGDILISVAGRLELVEENAELGPVGERVDVGEDGGGHCDSVSLQKDVILSTHLLHIVNCKIFDHRHLSSKNGLQTKYFSLQDSPLLEINCRLFSFLYTM